MDNIYDQCNTVIFDNGTQTMRVGMATDNQPEAFPSVVGRPKYNTIMIGANSIKTFFGEDALAKRGVLKLSKAIQRGIVINWDNMNGLWHNCFYNRLRIDPSENNVLLSEVPGNPIQNREKSIQEMFQSFLTKKCLIQNTAALSLYSAGKTTGVVMSSGQGATFACSLFEGSIILQSIRKSLINGELLTCKMAQLIKKRQLNSISNIILERKSKLFKQFAQTHLTPVKQQNYDFQQKKYILPDGTIIQSNVSVYECPQNCFKSNDEQHVIIPQIILQSIKDCDIDLRRRLCQNIVLSGGNTLFPNFQIRLLYQLVKLNKQKYQYHSNINIIAPSNRLTSCWIGGSILTSLSSFQTKWITRQQYQQYGCYIVRRKCF